MKTQATSLIAEHASEIITAQHAIIAVSASLIIWLTVMLFRFWWRADQKFKAELMTHLQDISLEQRLGNKKTDLVNNTLLKIEKDLQHQISVLDKRVSQIETKCDVYHGDDRRKVHTVEFEK